jgi:crotonobetainyl-CoA:carnitine CoA-transferase CaiB-like acyl-CoA transferase
VNELADVVDDEHVRSEGYLSTLTDGVRTVTMPFLIADYEVPQRGGPMLDAHHDQILEDWHITDRGTQTTRRSASASLADQRRISGQGADRV